MPQSILGATSYSSSGSGSGVHGYEYEYEFELPTSFYKNSISTSVSSSMGDIYTAQAKTIRVLGYGINLI